MKIKDLILLFAFSFGSSFAFAHEGHHSSSEKKDTVKQTVQKNANDSAMQKEMEHDKMELDAHHEMKSVDAFPNYHPLVVHFPIVLLLAAALFQLLSFFIHKNEFSLAALILLALGVIGTWLSSHTFHAHPGELSGKAKEIFETHERMADLTWWFSLGALAIKIISHFFLSRKMWSELIVGLLLIGACITVSIAGHHGAMLVHMEGIGPKGEFLEAHDHDD